MKKAISKKINFLVLIIFTIIVLYFSLKDNFNLVVKQIFTMNIWFLLIAFLLLFIFWMFKSYSMYSFCKKINKDFKFTQAFQLILRTQFFNAITPFATGGQPYQLIYLKNSGLDYATSTSIIMENFIVYQIALVSLGLIALFCNKIFHIFTKVYLLQKLVALGFIVNTLVIVVMFLLAFSKKTNKFLINFGIKILIKLHVVKDKEKTLDKWNKSIEKFHESAIVLLKEKNVFLLNILYNLLGLTCLYLIPLFVIYATGDFSSVNAGIAIVSSAYVMIMGSFVPIPGGTGGLEYCFVAFYSNFISGKMISAIMLVWRFITYFFGVIIGAIALNIRRVK